MLCSSVALHGFRRNGNILRIVCKIERESKGKKTQGCVVPRMANTPHHNCTLQGACYCASLTAEAKSSSMIPTKFPLREQSARLNYRPRMVIVTPVIQVQNTYVCMGFGRTDNVTKSAVKICTAASGYSEVHEFIPQALLRARGIAHQWRTSATGPATTITTSTSRGLGYLKRAVRDTTDICGVT